MATAPSHVSVQALSGRSFAFYPAIRNVEHNEWTLDEENWSELHVVNRKGNEEMWIPRNYVGSISSSDSPVLILGLTRELEFKAGTVWPYQRTVIEMPGPRQRPSSDLDEDATPPPVLGKLDSTESRMGSFLATSLAAALVICLFVFMFAFDGVPYPLRELFRPSSETTDQRYLGLTATDDYHDITSKLGKPEQEQWISLETNEIQFELLMYPSRSYTVVLMGPSRQEAHYIGALHLPSHQLLDSVKLANGGSTNSLLKNLPKF